MLERPEERAARVHRVVEVARLEREQECQVRALRSNLPGLGGETSCLGDGRRVPGAPSLDQREHAGDDCRHEGRRHSGKQRSQAPGAPPCLPELAFLRSCARLGERSFTGGEVDAATGPVESRRQPRPSIQLSRVAADGLPRTCRFSEVAVDHESLAILVQPSTQPRPLPDQSLVSDLRGGKGTAGSLLVRDDVYSDLREMIRDLKRNPWKLFWKE